MGGIELREQGLDIAEINNAEWLEWVRDSLQFRAVVFDTDVSADDAREFSNSHNCHPKNPQAAYGAIFRGKEWEYVGMTRSKHPGNHGRRICVWRLKR